MIVIVVVIITITITITTTMTIIIVSMIMTIVNIVTIIVSMITTIITTTNSKMISLLYTFILPCLIKKSTSYFLRKYYIDSFEEITAGNSISKYRTISLFIVR